MKKKKIAIIIFTLILVMSVPMFAFAGSPWGGVSEEIKRQLPNASESEVLNFSDAEGFKSFMEAMSELSSSGGDIRNPTDWDDAWDKVSSSALRPNSRSSRGN